MVLVRGLVARPSYRAARGAFTKDTLPLVRALVVARWLQLLASHDRAIGADNAFRIAASLRPPRLELPAASPDKCASMRAAPSGESASTSGAERGGE